MYDENNPSVVFTLLLNEMEFNNEIQIKYPFVTKEFIKNIIEENNIKEINDIVLVDLKEHYNYQIVLVFYPLEDNKIICVPKESIIHNKKNKNILQDINLREPMTSIFSMFPVLADNINKLKTEKAISNLEAMHRQSYILLKNINNISLANKILMNEEFTLSSIDISSFIESILFSVKEILPSDISFELDIEKDITIKGSRQLLNNGILALISNSLKYKQEELKIKIEVFEKNKRCNIVYKDNSIGIKNEFISDVFNSYYSKNPYNDGEFSYDTGVGLFILKTAVETSKGTIFLTSEFSKGVNYTISIPLSKNDDGDILLSKSSDYLLNRYSDIFVQLSEYCNLPNL